MSLFGQGSHGFSLKALLEDPNLQTPPNIHSGYSNGKKGDKPGGLVPNVGSAFLGPSLWEKPGDNSNDLNLEYMDLDEFLSENGIPIDPDDQADEETINMLASALTEDPTSLQPPSPDLRVAPSSPENAPAISPIKVEMNNMFMSMSPLSSVSPGPSSPLTPVSSGPTSPRVCSPQTLRQPSAIEKCLLDDNFGVQQMVVPINTSSGSSINSNNTPAVTKKRKASKVEYSVDPDDLSLASIPGQLNFDPTSRKFTDEELKPQPIIKKSKKVFVDDVSKDEKYWKRRNKNNIAAKRSRDARRVKENQIAMRAAFLEKENDTMQEQLEKLQKENESLIQRLSKYEEV